MTLKDARATEFLFSITKSKGVDDGRRSRQTPVVRVVPLTAATSPQSANVLRSLANANAVASGGPVQWRLRTERNWGLLQVVSRLEPA